MGAISGSDLIGGAPENPASNIKVGLITAAPETVLTLYGDSAALFYLVGNELWLRGGSAVNYEATLTLALGVRAGDGTTLALEIPVLDAMETTTGTAGADALGGSSGDAWRGRDHLIGLAGDDTLRGFIGDDLLEGGAGADRLFEEAGNDSLTGGGGADKLSGGEGADRLDGGFGNDLLMGGAGDDALFGGAGDDTLMASAGADVIDGGAGFDVLSLAGLTSGATLNLAAGTLSGGVGDDLLTGGAGADRFVFAAGGGSDEVHAFTQGQDKLVFSGASGLIDLTISGDHISWAGGSILLVGFSGNLTATDFMFAI